MKRLFFLLFLFYSFASYSQQTRDTALSRCPVYITDTVTGNNFFIEARPCIVKVYKSGANLRIVVEQKDQFLTILFNTGKLKAKKYTIKVGSTANDEVGVKYSFKSGEQVSYIDLINGSVLAKFDKAKKLWQINTNGLIADQADRGVSYYKVKAELWIK
ncbi:MAG: hypothetical protein RIR12_108 [Bacteroidota bacterium]|jgi:hypothetical protein